MLKIILSVVLVLMIVGCATDAPTSKDSGAQIAEPEKMQPEEIAEQSMASYTDISVEEAKTLIELDPELVIIDVSPKYAQGHIPGAVNYYVGDGSLDAAIPDLDKTKEYLVYCHVDSASILGAQKLVDAGFSDVYRLIGNYQAWVDAGYEIE
ncbi:MAG: rhodanese-like domain-containing protein [Nanoarchaeota archaeon]|nr:rhodanese-like domain-containing protein [Nanoarchaeota archaeon]MBU1704743.1 rhodanese-like domain-containing protein [Nanoarchaeota archaeon]